MTNDEFKAWRERLHMTWAAAGKELGISLRQTYSYGTDKPVPLYIELACCELERRFNEVPTRK